MNSTTKILKRVRCNGTELRSSFQYRIQIIESSQIAEAVSFMTEYYLPRENLNKTLGTYLDRRATEDFKSTAKEVISEGISLAAFLEDDQGIQGAMIACNLLKVAKKDSQKNHGEDSNVGEKRRKIYEAILALKMKSEDVFTLYDCSSFIECCGLAVVPEYGRRGIGTEMLKAREEICKMSGIYVSATDFTSEASQKAAARAGYELLAELDLTTYRVDGEIVFPNPSWPNLKWMAIKYDIKHT